MTEDIVFVILLQLPVASLLRFKRVCKSWFSLIESPIFVNQHLHHRNGEDTLIVSKSGINDFCFLSGNKYEITTDIVFNDRFYKTIRANGAVAAFDLVDSCDGIICLHDDWPSKVSKVALWNPAIKQLKLLPQSSFSHEPYSKGNTVMIFKRIGFGFDAKANDYKVVRIIWHLDEPYVNQVEVYSLRTSFSWEIIHMNGDLPFTYLHGHFDHATSKKGTCFWLGDYNDDSMLVAFDLENEVFKTMSLPDSHGSKTCSYALDFLHDKLAYIRGLNLYSKCNDCFEIWLLYEFGMKESWTKIYDIGPTPRGLYPTGFSKNGEFLLLRSDSMSMSEEIDQLYLYNLGTRETMGESYAPIQKPNLQHVQFFSHYSESLVSISG